MTKKSLILTLTCILMTCASVQASSRPHKATNSPKKVVKPVVPDHSKEQEKDALIKQLIENQNAMAYDLAHMQDMVSVIMAMSKEAKGIKNNKIFLSRIDDMMADCKRRASAARARTITLQLNAMDPISKTTKDSL